MKKIKVFTILFILFLVGSNAFIPIKATSLKSKAGLNDGLPLGYESSTIPFISRQTQYSADLNMQFVLELATDKTDITSAVNFIHSANTAGFIPIIRLCYVGGCNFASASDIYTYYQQVSSQVTFPDTFVATLGPNEAGSGEMEAFGLTHGDYTTLVNWAETSATQLQSDRVVNGGNMYLAPAIFNGTNSGFTSDDVVGYLYSSPTITPSLYDYLMANEYDVSGQTSMYFYDESGRSVRQYVLANSNLRAIISENGYFSPADESSYSASYLSLCQDSTINGILFFRPFDPSELPPGYPAWTPRQNPAISIASLHTIINSCSNLPVITCASFTYSAWGACVGGTQSRTVTSSYPNGCTGGSPVLTQSCTVQGAVVCGNLDSNSDGRIDLIDFANFARKFNHPCSDTAGASSCGATDGNGDGVVDIIDFARFARKFNTSC